MEFHEKLQELRKQRGMTQEELAAALYVSRTAVSKWESGRGYPSIDSLKAISGFFGVSLDQLLSSEAVLTLAEEDSKEQESRTRSLVFGALDCCTGMLLVLPLFGQRDREPIRQVSLLSLTGVAPYMKGAYLGILAALVLWGMLTLAFQTGTHPLWLRLRHRVSLGLSAAATLIFMASLQPYPAIFAFLFLAIKGVMLIKCR